MNFQGIKEIAFGNSREVPTYLIKNEVDVGISKGDQEKIMWNFPGVFVFGLGISKVFVTIL